MITGARHEEKTEEIEITPQKAEMEPKRVRRKRAVEEIPLLQHKLPEEAKLIR